jgi:hypothetical protein
VITQGFRFNLMVACARSRNSNVTQGTWTMKQTEPPSCRSSLVFIGKNSHGNWVAQEQNGLFGGLFINRAEAVRYALFENGHHPEAIVPASSPLELDMGNKTDVNGIAGQRAGHPDIDSFRLRRVA